MEPAIERDKVPLVKKALTLQFSHVSNRVMRKLHQGKEQTELRTYLDHQYSSALLLRELGLPFLYLQIKNTSHEEETPPLEEWGNMSSLRHQTHRLNTQYYLRSYRQL